MTRFRLAPALRATSAPLMMGIVALLATTATAQEPINAFDSATAPSPGHVILKEQFRYTSFRLDNGPWSRRGDVREAVALTTVNIGLTRDLSLGIRAPAAFRSRSFNLRHSERDAGIDDVTTLLKYRFLRHDSGPLDTLRMSLIAGAEIRSGDGPFTSDSYNPILGLAYTQIAGRHGFNAALAWTFTTGGAAEPLGPGESTADLLRYDAAYLYRVSPAEYAADTHGALYAVLELNGLYETNGDNELFIAPGLMYEARWWTAELSVQAPIWQDVSNRAESRYTLVAGLRFSF